MPAPRRSGRGRRAWLAAGLLAALAAPARGQGEVASRAEALAVLPGLDEPSHWLRFGSADGLPDERVRRVWDIAGGVWASTEVGLAAYDGYRWHALEGLPPGPPADVAPGADGRVVVSHQGRAYVGSRGGPVERYELGAPGRLMACEPLPDGDVALLVSRDDRTSELRFLSGAPPVPVPGFVYRAEQVLTLDARGEALWVSTSAGLFRLRDKAGWERLGDLPEDHLIEHLAVGAGAEGSLAWVREPWNRRGLYTWTEGVFHQLQLNDHDALIGLALRAQGEQVVTLDSGRVFLGPGVEGSLVRAHPLPRELRQVHDLSWRPGPDRDLWIATEHGLYLCRERHPRWRHVDHAPRVAENLALEYLETADGTILIGTNGGLVRRPPDGPDERLTELAGRPVSRVTALAEDGAGNLWVASGAGALEGALCFDGQEWRHFGPGDGLGAEAIHKIRVDRRGRPWFLGLGIAEPAGRDEPGTYVRDGERFEPWRGELPSPRVYEFLEDAQGAYWFATLGGIARWTPTEQRSWTVADGLVSERVFALAVDADGWVWFGHERSARGLGFIDPDGRVGYTTDEEAAAQANVVQVCAGAHGSLWVATLQGVFLRHDGTWVRFTSESGLRNDRVRALLPLDDRLLVGTFAGGTSTLLFPTDDRRPPRVRIGDPVVVERELRLGWRVETWWQQPAPASVRTRYRVDGGSWSGLATARSVLVPDLAYGVHELEVQAADDFGRLGEVQRQPFVVPRPLVLQARFILPLAGTFGLALVWIAMLMGRRRRERAALEESETRFRQLAENVREIFWLTDWRTKQMLYVSPGYEALTGHPARELMADGSAWVAHTHPDDREHVLNRYLGIEAFGHFQEEFRYLRADGGQLWLRSRAFPVRDAAGRVVRVAGIAEDVTASRRAEDALRQSEERYRALVEAVPDGILIHRAGRILFVNPAAVELFGAREARQLIGRPVIELLHPDFREIARGRMRRIEEEGRDTTWMDQKILRFDGRVVDVEARGRPVVFDGERAIQAVVHDITERKRAEERQGLLMRELDHRVKNNLAGVLALAQQTLARAGDLASFEHAFAGRVRALARTHEALAAARWEGVRLADLVRLAVTPYDDEHGQRFATAGPALVVAAGATQGLCMALHELATNAAKHGALSAPRGRVRVRWSLEPDGDLCLDWREAGGPPVGAPRREGLGLSLVRGVLEHELQGAARFAFERAGLRCELRVPAEHVSPAVAGQPAPS